MEDMIQNGKIVANKLMLQVLQTAYYVGYLQAQIDYGIDPNSTPPQKEEAIPTSDDEQKTK